MRKQVLELIRLEPMGQNHAESIAKEISNGNSFTPVPWNKIQELFIAYGIPLAPLKGNEYYVYYNFHSSSGYKTTLYLDDEGNIAFKINVPTGGVMCAFWSEVVIFCLTELH